MGRRARQGREGIVRLDRLRPGRRAVRILMVSPYPPIRDGIAAYAVQAVAAMRSEGHDVEVVSPSPSAAHHHMDLRDRAGLRALARLAHRYDKLVMQFHPDLVYSVAMTPLRLASRSLALASALRAAPQSEVFVHEIDYRMGRSRGLEGMTARRLWRSVGRIVVHTEVERSDFIHAFGVSPERVTVTAHGAHFVRRTSISREAARRSLGISPRELVFLAIGFIQPHKGFDRAVRAFHGLAVHGCSLHLVGSVRVEDSEYLSYLAELRELVATTPGAHLHDRYVSDELFDRWLVASDVVVLPYRHIWSSGVLERALLYGRRVIATTVGGLSQQAAGRAEVTLVDKSALAAAMWLERFGAADDPRTSTSESWPTAGANMRDLVQEQVTVRAARLRGGPLEINAGTVASQTTQALSSLSPLTLPPAASRRPGFSLLKRLVQRATAWESDPLVDQVNALRAATIQALERQPEQRTPRDRDDAR